MCKDTARSVQVQVQRSVALFGAVMTQRADINEAFVTAETSRRLAVRKCGLICVHKKGTSFPAWIFMRFAHPEGQIVHISCTSCHTGRSRYVFKRR